MIESNFEYTESLINKINLVSMKKYNIITEIFMSIILIGAIVLFITKSILLGGIFSGIFVLLSIGLYFTNKSFKKSNYLLVGQKISIRFEEYKMVMTAKFGNKVLYNAGFEYEAIKKIINQPDFVLVYFDKVSAIVIPKNSFREVKDYKKAMEYLNNNYVI